MKPFIAAYVDENGLAYTDDISHPRSPPGSRSRALRGLYKPRDPYASTEEEPLASPRAAVMHHRTMNGVHNAVDHESFELHDQGRKRP